MILKSFFCTKLISVEIEDGWIFNFNSFGLTGFMVMVENISAADLLPAELRQIARIRCKAESISGKRISLRDPQLFQKLEEALKGSAEERFSEQLWDLESDVSHRTHGTVGSFRMDSESIEVDEEYLTDGTKVTVEKHKQSGVCVKYYDYSV